MASQNPVIEVAKEQQTATDDDIHTLSTGVRVRIQPVAPALINDVMLRVKVPQVPRFWNESRGKYDLNPLDPGYHRELERYEQERGSAALDAVAMFGIELVDGMPEDVGWIVKLRLLGIELDKDDPIAREFYYKKYVAFGNDLNELQELMGVTPKDVSRAKKS